ncbi:MAG: molecular chaperone TorD family protein [Betaproteobacteria bacterium]|nr:molecular chaperone TorD family protein [Betaproteobacteria bacterium]
MSSTGSTSWLDPQAREQLYHFLAAAYLRPLTPEAVRQLTDPGVLRELGALYGEDAIAALTRFSTGACGKRVVEGRQQEFMDLFAVPAGRYVTPFEDVYRDASAQRQFGPLLGKHAVAVKRLYRAAGGEVDENCKELSTHVGVELAFMSFLSAREAAALRGERDASAAEGDANGPAACAFYRALQLRFLREHLNAWFPQLSRAIQEHASSDLYRGLAKLTETVLAQDAACSMSSPSSRVAAPAAAH